MELTQKIENVKKEIEELKEKYSTIYNQVEERLQKEIKLLIDTNLKLETQITIKMCCLQRYRLDFNIYFGYEDSISFRHSLECRYCIEDFAIVNPTQNDIKLNINYTCGAISKEDKCGLDCIKVLGLLVNELDFVENSLWFLVNNKDFIELGNNHTSKQNELYELKSQEQEQELQNIKNKIKIGVLFKVNGLDNYLHQIVKITNKYIHYEQYMVLSENSLKLVSNASDTPRKINIDNFIQSIKWKDFYFLED